MLAGRFGLIGVQVLIWSLNLFSPQDVLQCFVFFQGPKMNGAVKKVFLDASLAPSPVRPSASSALTKRCDNIVVADMEVDLVADKVVDMVADKKNDN